MRASRLNTYATLLLLMVTGAFGCKDRKQVPVTFIVADPGHFHAALVLKTRYPEVDSTVYVFAPEGPDLLEFTRRVDGYGERSDQPARWILKTFTGPDFFNQLLNEKPGNVLVLAGNNQRKTEYIQAAVNQGIHVFADKPMAINSEDFELLKEAFRIAGERGLLLYDIMTERFEITSILQKRLSRIPELFGNLLEGTSEEPAITKESVHHFFKYVSGSRLVRPAWFFDVEQEGEGIVDVTTHLVDLVQWTCFPEQIIDYKHDIQLTAGKRWNTVISAEQFRTVTGVPSWPDYLLKYVGEDSLLHIPCNGTIDYVLKGIHARVSVIWNYQAPEGGGDTHFSVMRGSKARLEIRQGPAEKFRPELYIIPANPAPEFERSLAASINELTREYPGISFAPSGDGFRLLIPDALRVGHEAHFAQVTANFLEYLKKGNLPEWEVPNMLAKYWLTTEARRLAGN